MVDTIILRHCSSCTVYMYVDYCLFSFILQFYSSNLR